MIEREPQDQLARNECDKQWEAWQKMNDMSIKKKNKQEKGKRKKTLIMGSNG